MKRVKVNEKINSLKAKGINKVLKEVENNSITYCYDNLIIKDIKNIIDVENYYSNCEYKNSKCGYGISITNYDLIER